jgi:hypothetical protein
MKQAQGGESRGTADPGHRPHGALAMAGGRTSYRAAGQQRMWNLSHMCLEKTNVRCNN